MLAIPPAMLDMLQLHSGSRVNIAVERGCLFIEPEIKKQYTMQELLTQCDASVPLSNDDSLWTASAPKGKELV
jgi:antitoxin ChpS